MKSRKIIAIIIAAILLISMLPVYKFAFAEDAGESQETSSEVFSDGADGSNSDSYLNALDAGEDQDTGSFNGDGLNNDGTDGTGQGSEGGYTDPYDANSYDNAGSGQGENGKESGSDDSNKSPDDNAGNNNDNTGGNNDNAGGSNSNAGGNGTDANSIDGANGGSDANNSVEGNGNDTAGINNGTNVNSDAEGGEALDGEEPSDNEPSSDKEETDPEDPDKEKESEEDTEKESEEETDENAPAFLESVTVDGTVITVSAGEGVFPEGATLTAELVPEEILPDIDAAVEEHRIAGDNVAVSYTFDIKVLDSEDNEIQPSDKGSVQVSFSLAEVANTNLDTQVYHIEDQGDHISAAPLEVVTEGETAIVETEGFSYYTVEFTYGSKTFVLANDDATNLRFVLEYLNIEGEPTQVDVSDASLISVTPYYDNDWIICPLQSFYTEEWMKVTVDDVVYEITLTDEVVPAGTGSGSFTFAANADIATVTIDKSKFTPGNVVFTDLGGRGSSMGGTAPEYDSSAGYVSFGVPGTARHLYMDRDKWMQAGSFSITYKDAAVLSNGARKDLVLTFNELWLSTRVSSGAGNFPYEDHPIVFRASGNQGQPIPSIEGQSRIPGSNGNAGRHFGFRVNNLVVSVGGADSGDTYFYTAYGINIDRSQAGNFQDLTHAANNNYFSESLQIQSGIKGDGNVYIPDSAVSSRVQGNRFYPALGVDNDDYASGFAVVADALNGLGARVWQSAPMYGQGAYATTTDFFLLPDKITHNYVSSSGRYGKIELWADGKIDGQGLLYGGRFVTECDENGTVINKTDQKRVYDVPLNKSVAYKMTPESGFIIDKLYIDGSEVSINTAVVSGNLVIKYNDDGTVKHYEYTFPADSKSDEDAVKDYDFDPRSSDGGFAHTIHVTWQPSFKLDFTKEWIDENDRLKLRPANIEIVLSGCPDLVHRHHKDSAGAWYSPSNFTHTLVKEDTLSDGSGEWSHSFVNLPMYKNFDEVTLSGDLIEYSVTESAIDYYTELFPHVVEKTDTAGATAERIVDNDQDTLNHRGFTESASSDAFDQVWTTNPIRQRVVKYKIVNRLYTGGLLIEKDSLLDGRGSFDFDVTLKHPAADFSSLGFTRDPLDTEGKTWKKTEPLTGDTLSRLISGLPEGTTYTVKEDVPDGWTLLSSKDDTGEILAGDFYAYMIDENLYILKDDGYISTKGREIFLPTFPGFVPLASDARKPASTYYFDKLGIRIEGANAGSLYVLWNENNDHYSYAEADHIPNPSKTVTYSTQSIASGQYVVYPRTASNIQAGDNIIGSAVDRAFFQNIQTFDEGLKIEKQVEGNQASRDKYFKFTVELTIDPTKYSNNRNYMGMETGLTDDAIYLLINWQAELDSSAAVIGPGENVATAYAMNVMKEANSRNDDPGSEVQKIKFINGKATVDFYIQHGQSFMIKKLPYNVSYTITEYPEDYLPYFEIVQDGEILDERDGKSITVENLTKKTLVRFINVRDGIIPTGVQDSGSKAILIGVIAFLLMSIIFISRMQRKRRYR